MSRSVKEQLHGLHCEPGATEDSIRLAEQSLNVSFPQAYLELLRHANGVEGSVGDFHIQLWCAEELFELNTGYHVRNQAPGVVLIGSTGGPTALGIDTLSTPPVFVNLPFIGMCREDMLVLGPAIADLLMIYPPGY